MLFYTSVCRSVRCMERVWWCVKVTATDGFIWSVLVWHPYLRADSPAWSVEMVSESEYSFTGTFVAYDSLWPQMSFFFFFFLGSHTCFSCKTAGQEVTRCSVSGCGCYYHEDCVRKLTGATSSPGGGFSCPQHSCSTCCLERDLQRASKGNTTSVFVFLLLWFPTWVCSRSYATVSHCYISKMWRNVWKIDLLNIQWSC